MKAMFGLGCFWGAERKFWQIPGVYVTAVGYAGGLTPNPTYEEVCTGMTGHNEAVLVVYNPAKSATSTLLKTFFEAHDPTQGMRQGNDVGTQYRSGIYVYSEEQRRAAEAAKAAYEKALKARGLGPITTEIEDAPGSTSPRITTSNISPRTRTAIAGSAAPASPARSAPASRLSSPLSLPGLTAEWIKVAGKAAIQYTTDAVRISTGCPLSRASTRQLLMKPTMSLVLARIGSAMA